MIWSSTSQTPCLKIRSLKRFWTYYLGRENSIIILCFPYVFYYDLKHLHTHMLSYMDRNIINSSLFINGQSCEISMPAFVIMFMIALLLLITSLISCSLHQILGTTGGTWKVHRILFCIFTFKVNDAQDFPNSILSH